MGQIIEFDAKKRAEDARAKSMYRGGKTPALMVPHDLSEGRQYEAWNYFQRAQFAWNANPSPLAFALFTTAASDFFATYLEHNTTARTLAMLEFLAVLITDAAARGVPIVYREGPL